MSAPRRPVSLSRVLALLVERERDALLDAPIASLEREELEPLLTLARERGVETLRGLHGVSELEAALGELVSPSEQRALLRALLELSDDGVGPEARWSPRALVDEVPPQFPNEPEERRAWLSRHELDDVLDTPVEALRFLLSSHHARHIKLLGDHVSIGAWIGLRPSTRARLEIPEFDHAIARYLRGMVVRRRIERARESTWNDPPRDARLRRLSERLRSSLGRLSHCQAYMAPLPRGHVLRVVMDPPEVLFGVPEDHPLVRIRLAGFADHGVLELRASDRQRGEVHARLVIEWCLDAIHDPAHPLHTPFVRLFAPAEGDPLLVGLERLALAQRLGAPQQEDTRLTWRVTTSADARCTVTPALQQRRGSGAWTRGRRVTIDGLDELLDGLAPEDVALARLLASADPSSTRAALAMLSRHPRVFGARGAARVTVHEQRLTIRLVDLGDGVRVTLALGGVEVEPAAAASAVGYLATCLDDHVHFCRADETIRRLAEVLTRLGAFVPRAEQDRLIARLSSLQPAVQLDIPAPLRGAHVAPIAALVLRATPLDERTLGFELVSRPLAGDEAMSWPPGQGPEYVVGDDDAGERVSTTRDLAGERARADALEAALGLAPMRGDRPHAYRSASLEQALEALAAARQLCARGDDERLRAVEWPEDARPWQTTAVGVADLKLRVERRRNWFSVDGEARADGQAIPLRALLRAAREDQRYIRLADGQFVRIERALQKRLVERGGVLVGDGDALGVGGPMLRLLAELVDDPAALELSTDASALMDRLARHDAGALEVPASFRATLRDYQAEGVRWLLHHAAMETGACLADEMGLGKTVQTLAALCARAELGPALVVAPTSVCTNWQREAARFAPDLKTILYRGAGRRAALASLAAGDVLIASYDVVVRDAEELGARELATVVLDEAQAIKNAKTRRAQAIGALTARWRLGLSGTPVENHLGELWSLFRVLSPGLLGDLKSFQERFVRPIEVDRDARARADLHALIHPFVLRRTKRRVSPELPEKTEVIREVELSEEETRLYERARQRAIDELEGEAPGAGGVAIFRHLTRLRQLACHPRLVDPSAPATSSKLASFLELADELREGQHRALVFSQFTSHLKIVQGEINRRGWSSLYLDGATPAAERAALVDRFQGERFEFFLISLKAGGSGLNLTAADYVIHLDPWWNPAVEDQASDRAHRIGQTRPVTIVRLITRDTVEQTVLDLHAEKRELAEGILTGSDTARRMSSTELVALLRRYTPGYDDG